MRAQSPSTVTPRPLGITLLAVLAGLAAIAHLAGALQDFGVIPAVGGAGAGFFVADPVDGVIALVAAAVSVAIAAGLWTEQSWARKAVVVIAALNILIIFFTRFEGGESWWNAVPGIIVNAAILLYARTPAVRRALDR
jgi:hypothetical protein